MGKRKIVKPIPWPIGLTFDAMRTLAKMKGIKLISRSIKDWDKLDGPSNDDLVIRFKLSNGQKLTFEKTRQPNGEGALCYRITKVENRERNVKPKKNPRTKSSYRRR